MLGVVMMNVINLDVIMMNVVIKNVIMMSVMAPLQNYSVRHNLNPNLIDTLVTQ